MINPKELRIGNLLQCQVKTDGPLMPFTILGIKIDHGTPLIAMDFDYQKEKAFNGPIFILLNETHHPIPLTPEILQKCGFVKQNYGGPYYFLPAARWDKNPDYIDTDLEFSIEQKGTNFQY